MSADGYDHWTRRQFLARSGRTTAGLWAAGSLSGLLAACGGGGEEEAASEELTGQLSLLLGSHMEPVKSLGKRYKADFGVTPRVEQVTTPDLRTKVTTALLARKSPWDAFFVTAQIAQELAAKEWLRDADSFIEDKVRPQGTVLEGALGAARYDGTFFTVPWTVGSQLLHWNKQLMEDADLDPEAPAKWHQTKDSWDTFVEFARKMTGTIRGQEVYGYTDAWAGTHVLWTWGGLLQMHGGRFLDDDLEPTMNSEAGVAATEKLFDLLHTHKVVDPAVTTYTWIFDASGGYLEGRRGMIITWPFIGGLANSPDNSKIAGKSGFAPNPAVETSASVDGSEFLAIPVFAKNEAEAWRFLELVASTEGQRTVALGGWAPLYAELLEDAEIVEKFPFYPAVKQAYEYPVDGGWSPDRATWEKILSDEIHAVLGKKKKPQEALDDAVKEIKASRER